MITLKVAAVAVVDVLAGDLFGRLQLQLFDLAERARGCSDGLACAARISAFRSLHCGGVPGPASTHF